MSDRTSWETNKEKLLAMLVLNDAFAPLLSNRAAPAFWRAFILQDRATGEIELRLRFKYKDPDERSWIRIRPGPEVTDKVLHLRRGMENVICEALERFGVPAETACKAIQSYYPPDDGGDTTKTIIWLEQQDLIEIVGFEPIDDKGEGTR